MASLGFTPYNPFAPKKPQVNSGLVNQYNTYGKAVNAAETDYSGIMDSYRKMLADSSSKSLPEIPDYTPATTQYKQGVDVTDAIAKQKVLSDTGGYSDQGIADLRERGISPI